MCALIPGPPSGAAAFAAGSGGSGGFAFAAGGAGAGVFGVVIAIPSLPHLPFTADVPAAPEHEVQPLFFRLFRSQFLRAARNISQISRRFAFPRHYSGYRRLQKTGRTAGAITYRWALAQVRGVAPTDPGVGAIQPAGAACGVCLATRDRQHRRRSAEMRRGGPWVAACGAELHAGASPPELAETR